MLYYMILFGIFLGIILALKIFFAHPIICLILGLLYLGYVKYRVSGNVEDDTVIEENYQYQGNNEDIIDVVYEEKV